MKKNVRILSIVIVFIYAHLEHTIAHSQTDIYDSPSFNSVAEQYILEAVKKGEPADLTSQFSNETDRVINAQFLEDLLSERIIVMTDKGVFIDGAIIDGHVNIVDKKIKKVTITNCIFTENVNIEKVKFENLNLSFCVFQQNFSLHESTSFDEVNLDGAIFNGTVHFRSLEIEKSLHINHAHFASLETVDFNSLKIGGNFSVSHSIFEGPLVMVNIQTSETLYFEQSHFNSTETSKFDDMVIGKSALLRGVVFLGPLNFGGIKIGRDLDFRESVFNSEDRSQFNDLEIFDSAYFDGVFFDGSLFFANTNIGDLLSFPDAKFTSSHLLRFSNLNIGRGAIFRNAAFNGPVDFLNIRNAGNFSLEEGKFLDPKGDLLLSNIEIHGDITLTDASITGGIEIANSNIKGTLLIINASFPSDDKPIIINSSNINIAFFDIISRPKNIHFNNCVFSVFHFTGSSEQESGHKLELLDLHLKNSKVTHDLLVESISVKSFFASNLTGDRIARLEDINIKEHLELTNSDFNVLTLKHLTLPNSFDPSRVILDGLVYRQINLGAPLTDSNWRELFNFIESAKYNAALYKNLELYLSENGYREYANEVAISQKQRERSDMLERYSLKWWWSLFLDLFVKFGKSPERAFLWSFSIVIIGSIIFEKSKMSKLKKDDTNDKNSVQNRKKNNSAKIDLWKKNIARIKDWLLGDNDGYSPFWYSLSTFIPGVDLGINKEWNPNRKYKWVTLYWRMHKILGWIIIPIALLSVSGIIR